VPHDGLFQSRAALEVENSCASASTQVLRCKSPKRLTFSSIDRLIFAELYRPAPGVLDALTIIKLETVIRWGRAGFRAFRRLTLEASAAVVLCAIAVFWIAMLGSPKVTNQNPRKVSSQGCNDYQAFYSVCHPWMPARRGLKP
jgi:hypothetical protein